MEDFIFKNRDVENAFCSCGGKFHSVEPTEQEEKKYGCSSKKCCVAAIQCDKCNTRVTFELCAPEMEFD
jgi:hypothetical protein